MPDDPPMATVTGPSGRSIPVPVRSISELAEYLVSDLAVYGNVLIREEPPRQFPALSECGVPELIAAMDEDE